MMFTSSFNLDLSEASIIEIIDAFVDFKRKFNPNYKSLNLRSVILRAEETFKCTLKPEQVTDIFYATVLCCNLGQRYSDIIRLCPENFNRNIYRTMQKKTGSKAVVGIDKYAIIPTHTYRLLEKYGYRSPYTSTASNFNHYLHKPHRQAILHQHQCDEMPY